MAAEIERVSLNLALQGGGAHGAFTWGVLDRVLEDDRINFDGASGASAGAVNAVLLAAGLRQGGSAGARAKLKKFWTDIARSVPSRPILAPVGGLGPDLEGLRRSLHGTLFDIATRTLSPYQLNPFDYNPLRELLTRLVDFEGLRARSPLRLHIAATDVATGEGRIFRGHELSCDTVLASACLPHLHHAVQVDGRYFWDGAYTANPPLMPLIEEPGAGDTLIVQIIAAGRPDLPVDAPDITEQLNRIIFGEPLRREVRLIEAIRARTHPVIDITAFRKRRIKRHRFHHIDGGASTLKLPPGTRLTPDIQVIDQLFEDGRNAATTWLERNFASIGRRSTVDLAAQFA